MKCSVELRKRLREVEYHLDHAGAKASIVRDDEHGMTDEESRCIVYGSAWEDVQKAYDVLQSIFVQIDMG